MKREPNKCKYVEGNQSALKTFAMRVFGRIHEADAQRQIKAEKLQCESELKQTQNLEDVTNEQKVQETVTNCSQG